MNAIVQSGAGVCQICFRSESPPGTICNVYKGCRNRGVGKNQSLKISDTKLPLSILFVFTGGVLETRTEHYVFFFDGAVLFLYNAITIGRLIMGNRTGEIENAVFIHCSREFSGWMFALESPIFQLKIKRDYVTVFVRVTCRLSRIFTAVCHFFSENNF